MPAFSPREVLEEVAKRAKAREAAGGVVAEIRAELFDKQLAFIDDPSRNKAALCTRRAGKTSMWVRYATAKVLETPRALVRIWAVNRLRAKQLLWDEFKYLFQRHGLEFAEDHMHETELTIKFENGSEIRLLGADKDKEAQKKRGDKTIMEVVVEAQLFGPYLKTLVEEVAEPCLFDMKGTFCLEGTPGPLCVGYWWDASGREDNASTWVSPGNSDGVGAGWSCHRWSVLDNPHLPHARAELEALRKKRRWTLDNPTYIREWLGRWVNDFSALYYRFSETLNTFTLTEVQPWGQGWQHVLGWDLGSRDDMALVAWGWHPDREDIYEAFSWKKPGALAHEVMEQIQALEKRGFNFIAKVADTGGGGRMYVEEVMSRYSQVFEAAKKTEKYEHVRLFNDDLMTGHIKLQRGSMYAEEIASLPRDPDWPDPEKPETPPSEDPRFPNHCCFVAGTRVFTEHGDRPIESIRPGDRVWTRAGLKTVLAAERTGEKPTSSLAGLQGTREHPVWTENRGWVPLARVCASDVVLYVCERSRGWRCVCGGETSGGGGRTASDEPTACTSTGTKAERTSTCIERCGPPITARSPKGSTFTIETGTQATTISPTWNAWMAGNICPSTFGSDCAIPTPAAPWMRHWSEHALRLLNGIGRRRGASGTESTRSGWLPSARSTACRWFAKFAAACSGRIPGASAEGLAMPAGIAPVYALSVEGCHEFFAEGVLVSNCDSGLYGWRRAFHYLHVEEKPKAPKGTPARYSADETEIMERLAAGKQTEWWEPETEFTDDTN